MLALLALKRIALVSTLLVVLISTFLFMKIPKFHSDLYNLSEYKTIKKSCSGKQLILLWTKFFESDDFHIGLVLLLYSISEIWTWKTCHPIDLLTSAGFFSYKNLLITLQTFYMTLIIFSIGQWLTGFVNMLFAWISDFLHQTHIYI